MIRISAYNCYILLLKSYITKVLEYKANTIKFVCVVICSSVMNLYSRDLPLIMHCRLITQRLVFDDRTSTCSLSNWGEPERAPHYRVTGVMVTFMIN